MLIPATLYAPQCPRCRRSHRRGNSSGNITGNVSGNKSGNAYQLLPLRSNADSISGHVSGHRSPPDPGPRGRTLRRPAGRLQVAFRRGFNRQFLSRQSRQASGHISDYKIGNDSGNISGNSGKLTTCARYLQIPNIPAFSEAPAHAKRKSRQKRQRNRRHPRQCALHGSSHILCIYVHLIDPPTLLCDTIRQDMAW